MVMHLLLLVRDGEVGEVNIGKGAPRARPSRASLGQKVRRGRRASERPLYRLVRPATKLGAKP